MSPGTPESHGGPYAALIDPDLFCLGLADWTHMYASSSGPVTPLATPQLTSP